MSEIPILTLTTFLPLIGVFFLMFIKGEESFVNKTSGYVALLTSGIVFLSSIFILANFNYSNPDFQFVEQQDWIFNFVNYKVNGEKHNGPNVGVMFGVAGFPTLLILDQKGRVLERHDGALYHTGLKAMAERALEKVNG